MLLLRLSGSFLLRMAARALSGLLIQEPPRNTRADAGVPRRQGRPAEDTRLWCRDIE